MTWRIARGKTRGFEDVKAFLQTLNELPQHSSPDARALFDASREVVVARAPGRLDVMGGIADYSGSLVLQLPLREATFVAMQRTDEPQLRIVSLNGDETRTVSLDATLWNESEYSQARDGFREHPETAWAAYVAGVFLVLRRERGVAFQGGARVLVASDVPEGKGVSSSAALEVATMQAVCGAFDLEIAPREMALLCQTAENQVAGAPCGVMDQMAVTCGEAGRLLRLQCQPAELQPLVALPSGVAVWGVDSGERHAVSGADYGAVRVGAFMGYRIVAELAGLHAETESDGRVRIDDPLWNGYLANIAPSVWEREYSPRVPETMRGVDFLARYGGTTDGVTRVEAARDYAVRIPTAHPTYENFRVRTFAALLEAMREAPEDETLSLLGELMFQSHASYAACGLASRGTDRLVQLAREAGTQSGIFGAKITGGGSGGTVAILGRAGSDDAVRAIAEKYARETGHAARIFSGSSDGAAHFGVLKLRGE